MKTEIVFINALKREVIFYIGKTQSENFAVIDMGSEQDLWFHAKDESSCHVVCELPDDINKKELQSIIKTGALLCKINTNKLKSLSNVAITYTQIKNITTPEIFGGNNLNNSAEVNDNGNYFSFDGVSDQILFLDAGFVNPQLRFTGDVSYEFFIRLKDLTGGTSQLYNKSSVNEGVISANTSNKLVYSYGNGLGSQTFETTTTLTNSTWYHVVLVRDLTNTQKIYWYLNGIEDRNTTSTYSSAGTSVNNTYLMSDGSSDYTLADVGVIRIYNSALTAAQVSQNFNTQKSRFGL